MANTVCHQPDIETGADQRAVTALAKYGVWREGKRCERADIA